MKLFFALMGLSMVSGSAYADGFVCVNKQEALVAKVYNQTQPQLGTRNAAVMVLSDSSVNYGNKTIARFSQTNGTLTNDSSLYTANVDHRFNDSGRKGELIGGTKIGALKFVVLDLDFSYARPVADGAFVRGELFLVKRNGQQIAIDMDCSRYLKN